MSDPGLVLVKMLALVAEKLSEAGQRAAEHQEGIETLALCALLNRINLRWLQRASSEIPDHKLQALERALLQEFPPETKPLAREALGWLEELAGELRWSLQ